MAKTVSTITIRRLDEAVKRRLRLRAAEHGRSMEDEVRLILGAAIAETATPRAPEVKSAAPVASAPRRGLVGATIVLIIAGGIAAYKSLDLIRRLRERGAQIDAIMTQAAQAFVTPLSVGALTARPVFTELLSREDEEDVGHIRLARRADVVVVAPATADILSRMAHGEAGDLATAVLLATTAPVLVAPAMNPRMWAHAATQRNVATLTADGIHFVGPNAGEMAETNEAGVGRVAEPLEIVAALEGLLAGEARALAGKKVVVTSGPTHEPIDPVRYIANRSSGRQGHAIAAAARAAGAEVTLVSGPVPLPDPVGVTVLHVETAAEMLDAVMQALPADVAIMTAAVADWRVAEAATAKIKKAARGGPPSLSLVENPDILATVGHLASGRPKLVVGFAAETNDLLVNATKKLKAKGADWIVANDVSPESGVMGGTDNTVHLLTRQGAEDWERLPKTEVATRLVTRIADVLNKKSSRRDA